MYRGKDQKRVNDADEQAAAELDGWSEESPQVKGGPQDEAIPLVPLTEEQEAELWADPGGAGSKKKKK